MSALKTTMPQALRTIVIMLVAVLLNACAALWNPHVKPVTKSDLIGAYNSCESMSFSGNKNACDPGEKKFMEQDVCTQKFDADICEAINYAERWRQAYYVAIGDHSKLRSTVAALSIPLSAFALYDGITKTGSTKQIARFAVAGTAAYATGQFFSSTPQQKTYIGGAQALTCALFQARPYLIEKAKGSDSTDILANELNDVKKHIDLLQIDLGSSTLDPNNADYIKAQKALSHAQNVYVQGWQVRNEFHEASFTLRNRVDLITETVSQQLIDNEASLDKLLTLLGSMKANATTIGQGALPTTPASGDAPPAQDDGTIQTPTGTVTPVDLATGAPIRNIETDTPATAQSEMMKVVSVETPPAGEQDKPSRRILQLASHAVGGKSKFDAADYDLANVYFLPSAYIGNSAIADASKTVIKPKSDTSKPDISLRALFGWKYVSHNGRRIRASRSNELADDRDKLATAVGNLASALAEYDGIRNAVSNISACRPAGQDSGFTVTPAGPTATVAKNKSITFSVTNKVNTPSASLSGPNADADHASVAINLVDGKFNVVVTGNDTTGTDSPTLTITDGTGSNSLAIKITVTGEVVAEKPKAKTGH